MNRFKFCSISEDMLNNKTRWRVCECEHVELFIPRSAWREGCYLFRSFVLGGKLQYRSYDCCTRLIFYRGEWFYDYSSYDYDLSEWLPYVDQGEEYWRCVALLGESKVNPQVWKEFCYFQELRFRSRASRKLELAFKRNFLSGALEALKETTVVDKL